MPGQLARKVLQLQQAQQSQQRGRERAQSRQILQRPARPCGSQPCPPILLRLADNEVQPTDGSAEGRFPVCQPGPGKISPTFCAIAAAAAAFVDEEG